VHYAATGDVLPDRPTAANVQQRVWCRRLGAGRILKVEGHSGGSNYFGAKRRKNFFGAPHIFSCAHPVFDGIRGTTIKVKQF